jgi:malonate-semialdehyde dehydrogenase (acetylating)/methylmalonate-semialdehyde dehydrogenase
MNTYQVKHFINGEFFSVPNQETLAIINPATAEPIANVVLGNNEDVNKAIESAKQAFPQWASATPIRRARVIFKFKQLLEDHTEELAQIVSREHGKTIEDAKGSIQRGIELVEFVSGIPYLLKGQYSENVGTNIDTYTVRQPLGVCVGISPFNFPVMVPLWMLVPAIACGNTFILKPSEQDPSAANFIARLFQQAGLPDGVFNVIHGDKKVVDALITHPIVRTVTAVASTAVAEHIYQTAIAHGKRAHTFGGAKNHCVVMPDADLDQTAEAILGAAYGSAGERCMALSVVVAVGDEVADHIVRYLRHKVPELRVGVGTSPHVDMGPLVSKTHLEKVLSYVELGIREGASLVIDGRQLVCPGYENGYFLGACLFDQVKPTMRIYREEIFGPVLSIVRVSNFDEAIALVNSHEYGNGTAIFTHDGETARTYASRVQVGMVGINVPIPVPVAYHAFGGWKRSIFGDIDMHGDQSVQFYTKLKTVTTRWPKNTRAQGAEYHMPNL